MHRRTRNIGLCYDTTLAQEDKTFKIDPIAREKLIISVAIEETRYKTPKNAMGRFWDLNTKKKQRVNTHVSSKTVLNVI